MNIFDMIVFDIDVDNVYGVFDCLVWFKFVEDKTEFFREVCCVYCG